LCRDCHSHFHNDYKRSTRVKCTNYDFENYKCIASYFIKKELENGN
jgi:hypothetical protein